jgi:hypothetical protein
MDSKEYKRQYGEDAPIKCQAMCDRLKGDQNPAYQHGGKFSVFSEKFVHADPEKKQKAIDKAHKTRVENNSYTTTIEYWLKKTGGNIEEAQRLLTERQATFSLEICIEKYGEEEGRKRWAERQEQWIESYNNKTEEEMEDICKRKSNKLSFNNLWTNQADFPGIFYVLEIAKDTYKIGITTQSVEKRYGSSGYDIVKLYKNHINTCFQIEQLIKKKFKVHNIKREQQIGEFGWTETFKFEDINKIIQLVDVMSASPKNTTKLFLETFNVTHDEYFE